MSGGNFEILFLANYDRYRAEILVKCNQHSGHCVGIFWELNFI